MRQIVLDTETTGFSYLEGHRVIEIGAIEMINRKLTGNHFHCYLHPERDIDPGAQKIHGITLDFLKDKPKFFEIFQEFLNFIKNAELIIHNAVFDTGFLDHEFHLANPNTGALKTHCKIMCTLLLARQLHPGQKNSLDALCKRYSVDNSRRDLHGALLDAHLLSHVYLAMTGGQGTLFGEETDTLGVSSHAHKILSDKKLPLTVLKATAEENRLHQARLREIQHLAT